MDPHIETRFKNIDASKTFKNIVMQLALNKRAVLDIGCSYGEFLIHFGTGSTGVTIAKEEVAYGKEKGLDIRYGNIEDGDFLVKEKYDAVFANNLFEHLYSPHGFLYKVRDYLKPQGILILGVPCIPKIVSLLKIRKFRGSLAVAHINFFTRDTLIKTVERAGYRVQTARGFRFRNKILDHLLDPIYPHFYVVAQLDTSFGYSEKRMKELAGYTHLSHTT